MNDHALLRDLHLLTDKPVMYVANVDETGFADNPRLDRVREIAAGEGAIVVPICAAIEAEIAQLDEADRAEFLAELKLDEPGLNRVIRGGYSLLGLQTYFTAGPKEVRAWTVHAGATAPQAAGVIHTDFERGFIRAEVIAYTISSHSRARRAPRKRANCDWKARNTSSKKAMSCTLGLTFRSRVVESAALFGVRRW